VNSEKIPSGIKYLLRAGTLFLFIAALGPGWYSNNRTDYYTGWEAQVCGAFCHRKPERSFQINGIPMAACARCTGIFAGAAVGSFVISAWNASPFLMAAAVVNTVDALFATFGLPSSGNFPRAMLGFALGMLFSVTILQQPPATLLPWKRKKIL
jgi:uncharacterized membrane protein